MDTIKPISVTNINLSVVEIITSFTFNTSSSQSMAGKHMDEIDVGILAIQEARIIFSLLFIFILTIAVRIDEDEMRMSH